VSGRLALESGAVFDGVLFGAEVGADGVNGEVVFNTCMTGYQEVASDPSYAGQIVVMTYPLIGNYGCTDAALESWRLHARAMVVRELSPQIGHPRGERTLSDELARWGVPGLAGVDTRALTRHLREHGTLRGVIAPAAAMTAAEQVARAAASAWVSDEDLVGQVSIASPFEAYDEPLDETLERAVRLAGNAGRFGDLRIAVLDYGVKRNMLRAVRSRGASVVVLRQDATIDDVLAQSPHGVILSNGPGDPARIPHAVRLCQELLERRVPLLGICLGHQILGQAIGATTSRLKFGHHGGNHPVRDDATGAVFVTSQNHEFQVDASSIPEGSGWYVSERNLNDGSVEGLRHRTLPAFSVQYHPEGAPGPQDRGPVFDEFLQMCSANSSTTLPEVSKDSLSVRGVSLHAGTAPAAGALNIAPGSTAAAVAEAAAEASTSTEKPRCVLVIGSGPIIIGQAAEFDYAGTQACKALREEGIRVVLVNSNPATIMTDDDTADAVYVEPLTVPVLERIIAAERPDGLLATLGGQTGLNLAVALDDAGVLDRYGVRLLGTPLAAIKAAEDRELFKQLLIDIGEPVPVSATVSTIAEARAFKEQEGLPLVVRPAFTLGGTGGGLCETEDQYTETVLNGLAASPIGQVLVERSLHGWRELEYEVMRDASGTCITVCNMENLDPMGVHTGDSIVVAPSQTLTDREHQQLRSAALRIISALRIAGGCNVQFALAPDSHEYHVIEVNPRVSRSSALASKATGYPIARVAAKIAAGLRLDEITNMVTQRTCAAFEPALDYCVVKIPRWPFDKFPEADRRLGTQMKSTGEVMAIERSFEAAMTKALRSLEQPPPLPDELRSSVLIDVPNDRRIFALLEALRSGESVAALAQRSGYMPWFVERLRGIVDAEQQVRWSGLEDDAALRRAKRAGVSDSRIAGLTGTSTAAVRERRVAAGIVPTYKCVDTCAAEFEAATPYYYSTFEAENEKNTSLSASTSLAANAANAEGENSERGGAAGGAVVVLGSGPIRIGQGIEFDYCSVQAAMSLRARGVEAVMVNSNPETVSTDFDTSSRLYFEPLDEEAAAAVIEEERAAGAVVQFGGQTAINLAAPLAARGVQILGSGVEAIDAAEDRRQFEALLRSLDIPQPQGAATEDFDEAVRIAEGIGFPVLVRPSYVLGGRAMEVVHSRAQLERYLHTAMAALPRTASGRRGTVLIDKYLLGDELEVDAVCDGETVVIPGIMAHVERAGVHSGDSMAVYPAQGLGPDIERQIVDHTTRMAIALGLRGLCNVQYVVHRNRVHVIEVNPRSSRTVPFISKVTGVPMVELATRVMRGETLRSLGWESGLVPARPLLAVKAPVFSMVKLTAVDTALGPEMKSTGEVMGVDTSLGAALEKAFVAALGVVPLKGGALCSIADSDKAEALPVLMQLSALGFTLYATEGTAQALRGAGVSAVVAGKLGNGRPNVVDVIEEGRVSLVINTVSHIQTDELIFGGGDGTLLAQEGRSVKDGYTIRLAAAQRRIPCCTSLDTARALVEAMSRHRSGESYTVAPVRVYRDGAVGAAQS
jgi:carbamoyl-phosphate synthase large subunit